MVKFYTSHCPNCRLFEKFMEVKGIKFEIIDDENTYLPIADKNKIMQMPFADIDGNVLNATALKKWIEEQ